MKNPIVESIEFAIAKHKAEITKYEQMLRIYGSEHHNPRRDAQLGTKRGPVSGVKRGPYNKTKKTRKTSKKFIKSVESPDWKVVIPKILKDSGRAMTNREINDLLFPTKHKKTRAVLACRSSAYLCNVLLKEGVVKRGPDKEGSISYLLS